MKNRIKYCIANLKMNLGTQSDIMKYFSNLNNCDISTNESVGIIISPPFTTLSQSITLSEVSKAHIEIAAQNVNDHDSGAFTGEVSVEMLKDYGIGYVIVGHSERRAYFNETNDQINKKNKNLIKNNMCPIFCVGETLEQRNNALIEKTLKNQIIKGLDKLESKEIILAYEPVWAIGTGQTATSEIITEAHQMIRNILNDIGFDGQKISILYGGSVNRNNAKELIALADVDGFLIGGASLDANHFYDIYKFIEESV